MTTTEQPAAPASELEAFLLELWGAALEQEGFGVDDDFFDLGGDSLLAVHVGATLSDHFGLDMTAVTPFETPTVRSLAAYIERQLLDRAEHMSDEQVAASLAEGGAHG